MTLSTRAHPPHLREALAVAELFVGIFRRDLHNFYPHCRVETLGGGAVATEPARGPNFRLIEDDDGRVDGVEIFGIRHELRTRQGEPFAPSDGRMLRAIGDVLSLRYHHLFLTSNDTRLELYRGGSEDHYIGAYVEPMTYHVEMTGQGTATTRVSRIASTIHTLRTAALSTYENHRVSTGALLLGLDEPPTPPERPTAPDAVPYGVELTSLKSIHRLCDGKRTLFLVDREGRLAEIIDVHRWANATEHHGETPEIPCARDYLPHARATKIGGRVCLVLSPNQEIKLFAGGVQAFSFAHGRWRILDPAAKFAVWRDAVADPRLARVLFQTALDLSECRHGSLFVVVDDASRAIGRLVAPHDVLAATPEEGPPPDIMPDDPLAKRALHYLARGRNVRDLAPAVLEALAGLDGALVSDRNGRLLAFGAILRNDPTSLPLYSTAEGARTTAAMIASLYGPVLKVSEDGVVSCFLNGSKVWDL